MGRTLSDSEEEELNEALELLEVKNLNELIEMARNQTKTHIVQFMDPKLVAGNVPTPKGKLRDVFVLIVNEFIKYAREQGTYPKLPTALSKTRLSLVIAEFIGQTPKTAKQKIDQLLATGWLDARYGNILDPVSTWYSALMNGTPHPGIAQDNLREALEH